MIGYVYPCNEEDSTKVEAFRLYFECVGNAEERFAIWARLNSVSSEPFGSASLYKADSKTFDLYYSAYSDPQKENTNAFFKIYSNLSQSDQNFVKKIFSKSMRLTKYGSLIN